jgi:hypothetical protein
MLRIQTANKPPMSHLSKTSGTNLPPAPAPLFISKNNTA